MKKTMQANGKKCSMEGCIWMQWAKEEEKEKDGPRQTAGSATSAMAKVTSQGSAHHRLDTMASLLGHKNAMDVMEKGIPKISAQRSTRVSKETQKVEEANDGRQKVEAAKDGKAEAAKDGKLEKGENAGTKAAAKEARASTTSI